MAEDSALASVEGAMVSGQIPGTEAVGGVAKTATVIDPVGGDVAETKGMEGETETGVKVKNEAPAVDPTGAASSIEPWMLTATGCWKPTRFPNGCEWPLLWPHAAPDSIRRNPYQFRP